MGCAKPVYKRILLKISGEALSGGDGILDDGIVRSICEEIKKCVDAGVQTAIVVGAGNIWRGRMGSSEMERTRADNMGMLATTINALALGDMLRQLGTAAHVMTPIDMPKIAETFTRDAAVAHLEEGHAVIFAGGTGCPFFSTDTAAVLRASEIGADAALLAKNIDAVYTADPRKDPAARKLDEVTYMYILDNHLGVIDLTAASLGMENRLPLHLFGLSDPRNITRAVLDGEKIGTVVRI